MADEGASSSSNSIDEIEEKQQQAGSHAQFSSGFCTNKNDNNCAAVSSSGHMGSTSQVFLLGKDCSNAVSNPFAIKTSTPTRSVADSTDSKETRPLLAPPTLKLDAPAPKIVLRPSALSMQVKLMNKHEGGANQEGKENSSVESNVVKSTPNQSTLSCESNGKVSKAEMFASGISTSSSDVAAAAASPPRPTVTESTFSVGAKNSDEQSSKETFIFGQNLHERALNYDTHNEQPSSPLDSHNLTFEEAALKKEELEKMEKENQEEKLKKSLSESAKEYESKQIKRKFDEVAVITGEEEESNVLQINCKLFAFDKVSMNWQERGRGILRLNDKEYQGSLHSRVVMRTHGSLRVVLNTKIWAGMSVEHPSKKTVRLTAYDPQGVKVFLVMAQPKDAEQLFHALDWRVATLKANDASAKHHCGDDSQPTIEEATSSSNLPDASGEDSYDNSFLKSSNSSDSTCGGADSSSETHFVPREASGDLTSSYGAADSTEIHS